MIGPLLLVISVSLLVEGFSDYKRHLNDHETNNTPCVILRRSEEIEADKYAERDGHICGGKDIVVNMNKTYFFDANLGKAASLLNLKPPSCGGGDDDDDNNNANVTPDDVRVAFQKLRRKEIRQGHFVLVKNREMVPADLVLLASSNDQGGAYIETSSIDGETNLKLRNSANLPKAAIQALVSKRPLECISEEVDKYGEDVSEKQVESIDFAARRITKYSYLGRPDGASVLMHPDIKLKQGIASSIDLLPDEEGVGDSPEEAEDWGTGKKGLGEKIRAGVAKRASTIRRTSGRDDGIVLCDDQQYIAALTTEPPNASVHTFSGKLTLPPLGHGGSCHEIALGADNVLLRGAVIRNTEWVIGFAFFTGKDTKLVQNSFDTPSKFSQLDRLINSTVVAILGVMLLCISYLAAMAIHTNVNSFEILFYAGYNKNTTEPWPYLPDLPPPNWNTVTTNWIQYFLLYVTLLNNFIPLSLYISVEMIQFYMLWLIYVDLDLYDDTTNTRGLARTTIVTDLGRIQYIFSDKTGTLTQNVMRFKRCSVDGMVFGAPVPRTRPADEDDAEVTSSFHPLRQLLVGRFKTQVNSNGNREASISTDEKLTFNSEMFLRVMSLCHTVVVEKDIDKKENISSGASSASARPLASYKKIFTKSKHTSSNSLQSPPTSEHGIAEFDPTMFPARERTNTGYSSAPGTDPRTIKNSDGAPLGYAYQAESPDEEALVSAASSTFEFQVVARDSNGIRLRCSFPTHFQDDRIVDGLKGKTLCLEQLAAETAHELSDNADASVQPSVKVQDSAVFVDDREETWTILAVNKFDSDRKRMSILLRSPPELGGLSILFCKGADSSMLDPEICGSSSTFADTLSTLKESNDENGVNKDQWELAHMLGMQVHLGEFAREGLRTLVLGMRVLTDDECNEWLRLHQEASVSLKDREKLLAAAACEIEKNLHIVGSTAIEDKLQKQVPETIATLAKAGIKLWVLTGDKRETAIEIGYSTQVLTSKMNLTEVPDTGKEYVRTQLCMEFIRLIKIGRLVEYQSNTLENPRKAKSLHKRIGKLTGVVFFSLGKCYRSATRSCFRILAMSLSLLGMAKKAKGLQDTVAEMVIAETKIVTDFERRRVLRDVADRTIKDWLKSSEGVRTRKGGHNSSELALTSENVPPVFDRAKSARDFLQDINQSSEVFQPEIRQLTMAHLTAHQANVGESLDLDKLVDEDTLSLQSFVPGATGDQLDFDKKKRSILERLFAVDRQVRKGHLIKHFTEEKLSMISEHRPELQHAVSDKMIHRNSPRALVIEGSALKHLLGDPEYEEILFAVASSCEAVIACRVSPRQKALLVNLVRHNVSPVPITLAIGDGANDVGMIQEAHVGVGISGKEGKQAVNASDFAIAQFRFLETLLLVHGRWNFFRLSTVVLFSFYKNAVMAGVVIVFTARTLYSGTPLFDEWILAMLNFVAAWPIVLTGFFDRCLSKEYVRKHPEVYEATRENQLITVRTLFRWIFMCFVHVFVLYFCSVPQQSFGGGVTPAFLGLMRNEDRNVPGDGEGGDLKSVGTVTFSCMIFLMAYKVGN